MITGDVYQLLDDLGEVPAGLWVVVDVGMMITLARLGEDEDGNLCTTHRLVKVTRDEMEQFVWMKLAVKRSGSMAHRSATWVKSQGEANAAFKRVLQRLIRELEKRALDIAWVDSEIAMRAEDKEFVAQRRPARSGETWKFSFVVVENEE